MLKSWSIENFKSIVKSGELELAPVTVLAGLNSSGKSSFLQSILMISQTLSSRLLDRPLLPNGPIIQLGTFGDILNETASSYELTVIFELEFEREELKYPVRRPRSFEGWPIRPNSSSIKSVKVTVQFSSLSRNSTDAPIIEASKVAVDKVTLTISLFPDDTILPDEVSAYPSEYSMKNIEYSLNINKASSDDTSKFLSNVSPEYLRSSVAYAGEQANYFVELDLHEDKGKKSAQELWLFSLSHFLPSRFLKKFKVVERRKQDLLKRIDRIFNGSTPVVARYLKSSIPNDPIFEDPLPEDLMETVNSLCIAEQITEKFSGQSLSQLLSWWFLNPNIRNLIREKLKECVEEFILSKLEENEIDTEGLEASSSLYIENTDRAIEQINHFFASKIRYLGPLRADPQASQKFAPTSELDDVGAKGEYAAAVYDANREALIEWHNPNTCQINSSTLEQALDTWAQYLGVAKRITINTGGQSGFSWQVTHKEGHKPLPLAAVGVGVSQILPILVMGLLAPKHTLLIIEQPELHLHPRVQTRLSDFFMGLAKCEKQCLIETHSENIVNQLRYHIVEAGGQEQSDCIIYFVDQDQQGAARFEPVEISAQGNILNWPEGFFDESMLQEDRITEASLKKRAEAARLLSQGGTSE